MTQATVDGCLNSGVKTSVVVVEKQDIIYKDCLTVRQPEPFNYNRCLNFGAGFFKTDYIAFLNNDLEPYPMWADNLIEEIETSGFDSGSPKCSYRHARLEGVRYGYQIGWVFCGWAFVMKSSVYKELGKLDESFVYWCSDNIVAWQMAQKGFKHLITSKSVINHLGNQSGKHLTKEKLIEYTWKEAKRFKEITGENIFPDDIIENGLKQ